MQTATVIRSERFSLHANARIFMISNMQPFLLSFSLRLNNTPRLAQFNVYVFIPFFFRCSAFCVWVYFNLISIAVFPPYYYPFIAMIRSNFCCYYYDNNSEYNLTLGDVHFANFISVWCSVWSTPYFPHLPPFCVRSFSLSLSHTI